IWAARSASVAGLKACSYERMTLAASGCGGCWRRRDDHDDRRITRGLRARLRIRVALRSAPRPVFHRHAGWKRHRVLAELADLEHVRRRFAEDEIAFVPELGAVVGDDLREARGGAVEDVALAASGVERRDE